ncbi:hypothetical protein J6590_083921 [Homalodisca vitripennis]|nr:hypothetical protein J6590_083921 [Homalodisca vitripennis]
MPSLFHHDTGPYMTPLRRLVGTLARPAPLRLVSCGRDTPTRGEPKRVRWALYTQRAAGHLSEGDRRPLAREEGFSLYSVEAGRVANVGKPSPFKIPLKATLSRFAPYEGSPGLGLVPWSAGIAIQYLNQRIVIKGAGRDIGNGCTLRNLSA